MSCVLQLCCTRWSWICECEINKMWKVCIECHLNFKWSKFVHFGELLLILKTIWSSWMLIQNIAWLYYAVHCLLVNVNFMFNILKYTIVLHIYIYVLVIGGYMVFIRNTLFVFFCNYYLNSFIYKYCFKFYFIGKHNAVYRISIFRALWNIQ